MSSLSTHVLDTASGQPVADLVITLSIFDTSIHANWRKLAKASTNQDGRVTHEHWLAYDAADNAKTANQLSTHYAAGQYKLHFSLQDYYQQKQSKVFYPYAEIVFMLSEASQHYHIPLLLSPFGYTTYRGS